jgi:hypothetical protein
VVARALAAQVGAELDRGQVCSPGEGSCAATPAGWLPAGAEDSVTRGRDRSSYRAWSTGTRYALSCGSSFRSRVRRRSRSCTTGNRSSSRLPAPVQSPACCSPPDERGDVTEWSRAASCHAEPTRME